MLSIVPSEESLKVRELYKYFSAPISSMISLRLQRLKVLLKHKWNIKKIYLEHQFSSSIIYIPKSCSSGKHCTIKGFKMIKSALIIRLYANAVSVCNMSSRGRRITFWWNQQQLINIQQRASLSAALVGQSVFPPPSVAGLVSARSHFLFESTWWIHVGSGSSTPAAGTQTQSRVLSWTNHWWANWELGQWPVNTSISTSVTEHGGRKSFLKNSTVKFRKYIL